MAENLPSLVLTKTPLRISFAGGGTDLAEYYGVDFGAVVSTTIDKFVYVTAKRHGPVFNEQYRLNYHVSENVSSLDDIRNDIARECLRLVPVDPPLYISTVSDLPAQSGLGGSSAFAVGLLNALHALKGERVSPVLIAEEAAHVEINVLKRPIGKQDHVAAAYGGLNHFRFHADGSFSVLPVASSASELGCLFEHCLLFWTGLARDSASVLTEQKSNTSERMTELNTIRDQAEVLSSRLRQRIDLEKLGRMLDEGWRMKRRLAGAISNDSIDRWYDEALAAGAIGGKLCGAGGGGFFLFVAQKDRHDAIREALPELQNVQINFEPSGSRVVLPHLD